MFCKTCGGLLLPKKTPYGKWMSCPKGHSQPELNQENNVISIKNNELGKVITVSDGKNVLAVHDHSCKRCGHGKAELVDLGSFYSDEDSVYKMKCGKCGFVEQLEGKVK
ncbi:MAG: hypothetical protein KKA62_03465 [Nanoarchaeota archaeon]|nr:hypothetical protein [Nanoarchaeota archaeon]MBU1644580.1 hypothetical protein [Nanoarchaeota archaeon]MBU1976984.1 hypothetical protein [Nanoarchaeota archaeon]